VRRILRRERGGPGLVRGVSGHALNAGIDVPLCPSVPPETSVLATVHSPSSLGEG